MKRTRRILLAVAWVWLLWGSLLLVDHGVRFALTSPEDREFEARFPQVGVGMRRSAVLELLGSPGDDGPVFGLRQEKGFEAEYERARTSGATRWLIWHVGIDMTYAVGIDSSDRVCMTSRGGS
ncbi:MAG TPA: hypothetical protein VF384_19885 [Planctomycetota bacterium]